MKKLWIIILVVVLIIVAGTAGYLFFQNGGTKSFELDTVFLKVVLAENSNLTKEIQITNTGLQPYHFSAKVSELENIVSLEKENFELASGEQEKINLSFNTQGIVPGIYIGKLIIQDPIKEQVVEIVLEVESKNVLFDSKLSLFPQGQDVIIGQKPNLDITIYDLFSIGRKSVVLNYFVESLDGETIISNIETIIVDEKYEYAQSLDLPLNVEEGKYILGAIVDYLGSVGTSTLTFNIVKKTQTNPSSDKNLTIIVGIFIGFLLLFLGLFTYSIFSRDKLFLELEKQHRSEIKRELAKLKNEEIKVVRLEPVKKQKKLKEIREKKQKVKKVINTIYKVRVRVLKQLKKHHKVDEMKKKLNEWKTKGYNVGEFLTNEKKAKANLNKEIDSFKKEGYKF